MKYYFTAFFTTFFIIYGSANYYIGLRYWQFMLNNETYLDENIYWLMIFVIAITFFLGRLVGRRIPYKVSLMFSLFGGYWAGFLFYGVLIFGSWDLLRVVNSFIAMVPAELFWRREIIAFITISVVTILVYGTINALRPIIKFYDVPITKSANKLTKLHIIMVSDIHLGNIINVHRLKKLIDTIIGLNGDLVLLVGDIIDEDMEPFMRQNMAEQFYRLQSKYGVYAVLGDHEYCGRCLDSLTQELAKAKIIVLRDKSIKIADSIYLVGRDNDWKEKIGLVKQQTLASILRNLDKSLPILLMDHTPKYLQEAEQNKVDVQFSGHTHAGQMFPLGIVTKLMYGMSCGYKRKGSFNILLSSGYGTWGPPIRVGNKPEIIDAMLYFIKPSK